MILAVMFGAGTVVADEPQVSIDQVIEGVEKRYAGEGFSALFHQKTLIRAMDIIDTAIGKLYVKRPGKMRWEYESPEKQIIITDGADLWIYKPEDCQVMKGRAPAFFGDGKGAGFLSDIQQIRKNFIVLHGGVETPEVVMLKLLTKEENMDLARIDLWISKSDFSVMQVTTQNAYGDETRIEFTDYRLEENLDDALFRLEIPEGTDVIEMD